MRRYSRKVRILGCLLAIGVYITFAAALLAEDSLPSSTGAAEKPSAGPEITIPPPSSGIPIREEVKILRAERRRKMPYLDRGALKDAVNSKTVLSKQNFSKSSKKDLQEVTRRAIEVYTPARAAKERISLAKRRILVAARELFPEMSFNFEIRRGSLSRDAFKGDDYHFTFKLPIFRGGILWNTLMRERAELRAARKEYEGVLNELVEEVAKAYFEFNRAREVCQDKKELLKSSEAKHRISQAKYKQALISEIENLNVESMVGQIQYDIETAEQELELAKLELQRFLNLDVADEVEISPLYEVDQMIAQAETLFPAVEAGEKRPRLSHTLEELIDLAYQHRPEIQVEAERLRSARLEESISRGAFLPRADLTMEFGELGEAFIRDTTDSPHFPEWHLAFELSNNVLGNKIKYTFDNDENAPSVAQFLGGSGSQVTRKKLEVGILDGLEEFADLKEAQVKKLEQVVELEKKEREVIRQVKEGYFDYHKARVQVESSLKRNQYHERILKLKTLQLEKTEIEISDYLQAELNWAEERGRVHQALADLAKAKSKLNRAIGVRDFLPLEERDGL